jgi:hypothetical protein
MHKLPVAQFLMVLYGGGAAITFWSLVQRARGPGPRRRSPTTEGSVQIARESPVASLTHTPSTANGIVVERQSADKHRRLMVVRKGCTPSYRSVDLAN